MASPQTLAEVRHALQLLPASASTGPAAPTLDSLAASVSAPRAREGLPVKATLQRAAAQQQRFSQVYDTLRTRAYVIAHVHVSLSCFHRGFLWL